MAELTKFTNNVVRAKAVKLLRVKHGGKIGDKPGSKFTNQVHRETGPKHTPLGDSQGKGRSHTMKGHGNMLISGGPVQEHVNKDNQVIRGI
mgnify:CR=1 FL=1